MHSVYVAEDDPSMRALLEVAVRRAGRVPVAVENGATLLARLAGVGSGDGRPALVLSDQFMPGPYGVEVAAEIRAWGWSVPFILLTAFPDDDLRERAALAGVDLVVSKPVTLGALIDVIVRYAIPLEVTADACPGCGASLETGTWCGECAPTGKFRIDDEISSLYIDLGDGD